MLQKLIFSADSFFFVYQATEIEELKQKVYVLTESKEQLEIRNKKLVEESSYAKGLASTATVELKALSEEVAKLMNQNERISTELAVVKNSPTQHELVAHCEMVEERIT